MTMRTVAEEYAFEVHETNEKTLDLVFLWYRDSILSTTLSQAPPQNNSIHIQGCKGFGWEDDLTSSAGSEVDRSGKKAV
jgi:hypothetical protein